MMFLGDFLSEVKKQSTRGRCLHFDRGDRCNEIVDAHSIQQSGQLRFIQENGHVYRIVADISVLKKSGGIPQPSKVGWNKVSTFNGFCQRHDSELFEPMDNGPLTPNDEQISLYAHRCLCREYFVKENAARTLQNLSKHDEIPKHLKDFMTASSLGQSLGFSRIQHHKETFDRAIRRREFNEFEYVCFASTSAWDMQLSGILSPDHDFLGQQIQNLGEIRSPLALITFFTAPMSEGWAYTFAWHRSSHEVCNRLMRTLATQVHSGHSIADALLRSRRSLPRTAASPVEKNQVVFHDVAAIELKPHVKKNSVAVELTDFSVFYSQDSIANAEATLKDKASKIVVEKGQIVKVSKDAKGVVRRERLTKKWTDWIDYWAVDFNFENKRELIRVKQIPAGQSTFAGLEPPQMQFDEYEEVWTGDYIFENEWQSFRTKKERRLELTSVFHECQPGRRKLAVKVVDIFGNDTMTIVEVNVGGKR
jgi:hypothetical protein